MQIDKNTHLPLSTGPPLNPRGIPDDDPACGVHSQRGRRTDRLKDREIISGACTGQRRIGSGIYGTETIKLNVLSNNITDFPPPLTAFTTARFSDPLGFLGITSGRRAGRILLRALGGAVHGYASVAQQNPTRLTGLAAGEKWWLRPDLNRGPHHYEFDLAIIFIY